MLIRVGCSFEQETTAPTHSVLQVEPRRDIGAVTEEVWSNSPPDTGRTYVDVYGNLCRRLQLPEGRSSLRYDALVEVDGQLDPADPSAPELPPDEVPDEVLVFNLPSRYCPSDALGDVAWQLFGSVEPGWTRVQAICDWVHANVRYDAAASGPLTTGSAVGTYQRLSLIHI